MVLTQALPQQIVGVYYSCIECDGLCFCFKCYRSKPIIHYGHHVFVDEGPEYDDEDDSLPEPTPDEDVAAGKDRDAELVT